MLDPFSRRIFVTLVVRRRHDFVRVDPRPSQSHMVRWPEVHDLKSMSSTQPSYSNLELDIADALLRHVSDSMNKNRILVQFRLLAGPKNQEQRVE